MGVIARLPRPAAAGKARIGERILRGMKQTEINDGLGVVALLVEQFRDVTLKSASTVRTFVELDVDSDSFKPFGGNKLSEGTVLIAVLPVLTTLAVWAGTRLGKPRPAVLP